MRDPLVLPCLSLLVAVALWPAWQPGPWPCLLAAAACGLLALAGGERPCGWVSACLGMALLGSAAPGLRPPGPALRGPVSIEGVVTSSTTNTADLRLARIGASPASGQVRVRTPGLAPFPGARVAVFGAARPVYDGVLPGEPDPAWTEALDGVRAVVNAEQLVVFGTAPPKTGPHPFDFAEHGGLLRAITQNDRTGLREEDRLLLRDTGTSHLLAISGLHIGLIAGLAYRLGGGLARPIALWWGRGGLRWPGAIAAIAAAVVFTALVGWPIPAQRSVWMVAGATCGLATSRGVRAWNLLALAAALVALTDPAAVRSVSFQLSFGAIAGTMAVAPACERLVPPDLPGPLRWLLSALFSTLGATLGTLPVCALVFQALPLCAPVANLVAIPLLSTVAVPAGLLGAAGWFFPAAVADTACDLALRWLRWVEGPILHPAVGPMGALALGLVPFLLRRPGLLGFVVLVVFGLRERPTERLTVSFLSIGQGDAALVELGDGRRLLIDGGPPGEDLLHWLRRRGIDRIDEVLLTHPHPDHAGGLAPVLESLEVTRLRVPRPPLADEEEFQALCQLAASRGVTRIGPSAPTLDPATMRVLHPTPAFFDENPKASVNDQSIVLLLRVGQRTLLFTGDIEKKAERWIAGALPEVDVLKVPHHGSRSSSTAPLLEAARPGLAIISCGRGNRFGHPHPEVERRYTRVHRTDRDGTLIVQTDGRRLRLSSPGASGGRWLFQARTSRFRLPARS